MTTRHPRALLAALLLTAVAAALPPLPAAAQSDVTGEWRMLSATSPINPIHVALLRTGKVLIASGSENDPTHTTFRSAVWDPRTGAFSVTEIPWDLFCNGMSQLADGRILIVGGNLQYNPFRGLKTTTIFEPTSETYIQVQDMARGRWYPSNTLLGDGKTVTFSGWLENAGVPNRAVEIYDVASGWSPELVAPWTPPLYPWMHLLPNGRVFVSGSQPGSHVFDPASRAWTLDVARTRYGQDRRYGSSVLLPLRPDDGYRPRVMIMGGNNPATATAEVIDLGAATPAWRSLPPMSAPRIEMNAVLLPTGKVLALGGSAVDNDASTASRRADLFDPETETWANAGTAAVPRLYHSVALLLPDATVWTAGSNPFQGAWDNRMEIYSPPYLFTRDSTGRVIPAPRPTISSAPARVGYNASFTVSSSSAADIAQVVLVRPGSNTHAFDFDQRLVELRFTASGTTLNVTSPPNANVAPPGYYMLFVINRAGTPSVARFVHVIQNPTNQPPSARILNPSADVRIRAGQSVTFSGDGTDADGSVTRLSWVFPGGSPATSSAATPGAVTFSTPGRYTVSLTVTDNLGENDPTPATRTITVDPAGFTAAITSPPAGATVNGTQTVGMSVAGGTAPFTYTLRVDSTQVFTTTSSATSQSYGWNTATVPDGSHTLTLTVRDGTGATATASRTVTVANSSGALRVAMTTPTPDQTVSGVVWVNVWVEGAVGPFSYTLTAAGATVGSTTSSATHVTIPWDTTRTPNGPQTLTATVTTSTRTGSSSVNVTVQNGGSPPPPGPGLSAAITAPAAGATVSGTTTVTMTASNAAPGNITYRLTIDGAVVSVQSTSSTTVTYAWDTRTYGDGSHTLGLTVTDSTSATASASRTVTVANSSTGSLPVALTSPREGATVTGTVWANVWVGPPPGTPPYTYTLTAAGATVGGTTSSETHVTIPWDTTRTPNGAQTLTATVRDAAGKTGSFSVNVTVQNAGSPPPPPPPPSGLTAAISSPAEGATVSGTVTVGMAAGGGTAPYRYTLQVDGAQVFTTTSSSGTASFAWNTASSTNGSHTLRLVVTDSASASAEATRTVTVSNGSTGTIGVALTSPRQGQTVSGTVWANVWVGTPSGTPPYDYTLTAAGATVWTATSSSTHVTLPWETFRTPDGPQTLTATVRDAAGRTGSFSVDVIVSNGTGSTTPPPATLTASFTSPGDGTTVSGTITIGMAAGGGTPPYVYTLQIDGTQVFTTTTSATSTSTSWNTTTASNASHTLRLTVRDGAGATATASRTVIVSNSTGGGGGGGTPLTVDLTSPRPGEVVSGVEWANIWVSGGGTPPFDYTLSVGGTILWEAQSSATHVTLPWETTRVPNGPQTFTATVRDSTGRTGSSSVSVVVQNP